jgi:ubiquinone/menaquinone biosynthesis C-methylase UbiE
MMDKGSLLDADTIEEIRGIVLSHDIYSIAYYSKLLWRRYIRQIHEIAPLLPGRGKILDIGCGMGHVTAMLSSLRPDLEIIGGDIQPHAAWAQFVKYYPRYLVCNGLALPFKEAFDLVTVFGVMEHTNNDSAFLKEIYRVLKPGGRVIIFNLPNKYSLSECGADRMGMWTHENKYTKNYIRRIIKDASLDIKSIDIEFFIPSQVARVSKKLEDYFNNHYIGIDKLDMAIAKSPLKSFCESWKILAQKSTDAN